MQWSIAKSMLTNWQYFVPAKWQCRCLRPKGKQHHVMEAYKNLRKETSIVEILQVMRVLRSFAKQSMTVSKWKKLRSRDSFKFLDKSERDRD